MPMSTCGRADASGLPAWCLHVCSGADGGRGGVQLDEMRKNEDPRLSFSTPEFKEAQRVFTENHKVRPGLALAVPVSA